MKTHEDLMKQRRRWINSSLFAFLYVFRNYEFNVQESKHGPFDKYILLNLSMILAALSFLTSYITPSIYFYIIYVTINQMSPDNIGVSIVAKVVAIIFVLTYLAAIGGGLTGTNWTKHAEKVSFVLSLFTFTMWGLVTYNIIFLYIFYSQKLDTSSFYAMSILVMTCVNLGCIIIVIGMHLFTHPRYVLKLIRDQISYMFYQGAYSMTMVAHAFCNVDDVSWGTKGSVAGGVNKY